MERISRDRLLMDVALLFKRRSTCLRRQVGAVLAREGRILSTGYGGAPAGVPHCSEETCGPDKPCIRTIHAEANVIAFAAKNGVETDATTLYCTASPCIECAKLIINAGIVRVVYDEEYRDTSPLVLLRSVGIRTEWHRGRTVAERYGPSDFGATVAERALAEGRLQSSAPDLQNMQRKGALDADSAGLRSAEAEGDSGL